MTGDPEILIIDDDELFREELIHLLTSEGYATAAAGSLADARKALVARPPTVVLLDIQLPDGNGVDFLRELVRASDHPEVVMISGAASLQDAADSVKHGATDFLEKPFEPARFLAILASCLRIDRLKQANQNLLEGRLAEYTLIGASSALAAVMQRVVQIAGTDARVLITGESGTGKELIAAQIHYRSTRADAPFVCVNCAALPADLVESELFGHERGAFTGAIKRHAGRFLQADGGTLLLDEIGDMPLAVQPKLLRVIETGEVAAVGSAQPTQVDVRVISATHRDLEEMVKAGHFRADLLYRINTVPLPLPALRDRREDIPRLSDFFLGNLCRENPEAPKELDPHAHEVLMADEWPGNVRQLKNLIERLFYTTSGETIGAEDVQRALGAEARDPAESSGKNRLTDAITQFERGFLGAELRRCDGHVTQLAKELGMDRGNLYRKLKKLGLLSP